jgi:hypothetical protein
MTMEDFRHRRRGLTLVLIGGPALHNAFSIKFDTADKTEKADGTIWTSTDALEIVITTRANPATCR